MKRLVRLLATLAYALIAAHAAGQEFPTRAIRVTVPFPPAGLNDLVARTLAQRMQEHWGQPVLVENRPGGGTIIGTEAVAKAAPDGYTLLLTSVAHAITPSLYKKLPYDIAKSFAPISLIATSPFILVVRPALPAQSLKEFVALAKSKPGTLTYSSTGSGGSSHLMSEMLKSMAGIDIVHVPYKGMAPAVADVVGGQVDFTFVSYSSGIGQIKAGRVRALAVSSSVRLSVMPELPTIAESGYPGYDANPWWGLVATAGTPAPVIAKLNAEVVRILKLPEVVQPFREAGVDVLGSTPAEYSRHLETEIARWSKIVRESGAKPD